MARIAVRTRYSLGSGTLPFSAISRTTSSLSIFVEMSRRAVHPSIRPKIQRNALVLLHESGHAVMAVIQGIPCHGVFLAYAGEAGAIRGKRFRVPRGPLAPCIDRS